MIVSDVLPANWRDVFHPDHRKIGIGADPATTTKKKSNPSAIAVTQQVGLSFFVRILVKFKTSDPAVTTALLRELLDLPHGLRARRLCILATNERFYAAGLRRELAGLVPVEAVIESEATQYLGERMLVKSYLGNQFVNTIDDGYLPLPDASWLKADIRQVERVAGSFAAEPDENGNHADGFCAIGASPARANGPRRPRRGSGRAGRATGPQRHRPPAQEPLRPPPPLRPRSPHPCLSYSIKSAPSLPPGFPCNGARSGTPAPRRSPSRACSMWIRSSPSSARPRRAT